MLHSFVVNPVAGRVELSVCQEIIKEICELRGINFEINVSSGEGDVIRLVNDAARRGAEYIYSIGGDGTLNEAANGIMQYVCGISSADGEKNIPVLVPVPCGTGNDFVRTIDSTGHYKKCIDNIYATAKGTDDYRKALHEFIEEAVKSCENVKAVDIGVANDRYFVNVASVGFDADVVINSIKYKKKKFIPNNLAYYISVFTTFISNKPKKVKIGYDGLAMQEKDITLVAVANGKFYGGGIIPAPDADVFDRVFDVCTVDAVPKIKIPLFFPKYAKGNHGEMKEVDFRKVGRVDLCCDGGITLNIDGEVSTTDKVTFEICEKQILMGIIK